MRPYTIKVTIWCPVCGQAINGILDRETGEVLAYCPDHGEVSYTSNV
jgi:hypothetical protein